MNNMAIALEIMAKGMGGIFVAIFVIMLAAAPFLVFRADCRTFTGSLPAWFFRTFRLH